MNDHHVLITQLCAELDHCRRMLLDDRQVTHPLADRARAALAADGPAVPEGREPASVVGEPSDEELLAFVPQGSSESDFYLPKGLPSNWVDGDFIAPPEAVVAFARAVLARWGHQSALPAEGEVAELVADLRGTARGLESQSYPQTAALITRAADLLEQRHPTPVPVNERLPGPEDCDEMSRCWWFNPGQPAMSNPHIATSSWRLCRMLSGKPMGTHWLPAHALPLPAEESNQKEQEQLPND